MANEEHVTILKQGTEIWNKWRKANSDVRPDFHMADFPAINLSHAHLREANLRFTDLSQADLSGADLSGANLIFSSLSKANLSRANLHMADLRRATLSQANLSEAVLVRADLREVNLTKVDLSEARLDEANWAGVRCDRTILGNVDLSQVKGLDTVAHEGPSYVDINTIYRSGGNIPEVFLRGAGVPDNFITFMKSLTNSAIDFYSCFISHSSKDKEFAERLYADLQSNGVRCWYAPHDMQIGAPILNEIDSAIRLHDKLLLILSEHSVGSRWVEHEVLSATTKEYQQERDKRTLFPIGLDDAVMDTKVQWARNLKETRHIADFTGWKDHDRYKKAFDRLLRDLKGKS